MLDDATRRLLRFSLFLQAFAGLMLVGAFLVRATQIGWDALTIVFLVGVLVVGGAMVFTFTRLRAG